MNSLIFPKFTNLAMTLLVIFVKIDSTTTKLATITNERQQLSSNYELFPPLANSDQNAFDQNTPALRENPDNTHVASRHHHHRHHPRHRHRRRLPMGIISKLFAKLSGKSGKVAAAAAGKTDDVIVGAGRASKNLGRSPHAYRGTAFGRKYQSRGIDPPPFNPYTLPRDEVARKARSKALTGANLALATGGIAAGIWYFSGENTVLFVVIIIAGVLLLVSLVLFLIIYLFTCRKRKKGYYAVNEEDMVKALAKKQFESLPILL